MPLALDQIDAIIEQNAVLLQRSHDLLITCRCLSDDLLDTLAETRARIAISHNLIARTDYVIHSWRNLHTYGPTP